MLEFRTNHCAQRGANKKSGAHELITIAPTPSLAAQCRFSYTSFARKAIKWTSVTSAISSTYGYFHSASSSSILVSSITCSNRGRSAQNRQSSGQLAFNTRPCPERAPHRNVRTNRSHAKPTRASFKRFGADPLRVIALEAVSISIQPQAPKGGTYPLGHDLMNDLLRLACDLSSQIVDLLLPLLRQWRIRGLDFFLVKLRRHPSF